MGTITNELEEAQEILDNFEQVHNLGAPYLNSSALTAIELTYEELNRLTPDTAAQYSYILEQYSFYLQRILNKETATLEWLNNKLEHLVCDKLNNYDQYARYDIKLKLIARENEVVKNLLQQINFAKQKIHRLEFLPTSIKAIAKTLTDIRQTKLTMMRSQNG